MIADNVKEILENIEEDSLKAGLGEKVKLIAVTKFHPVEDMKQLEAAGLTDFGENRVQEFNTKYDSFGEHINWHIIGSLQKNKLKYIIGKVKLIQSVDTAELAKAVDELSLKRNVVSDILIEMNVSGEESKHGISPSRVSEVIEQVSSLKNINVKGMMMMAPDTEDTVYLAGLFEKTRNIYDDIMKYNTKYDNINIKILSMGMSHDYRLAVRAGSNMVRLGRILYS